MKANASIMSKTFIYDFASAGGAIGTIDLGEYIPQYSIVFGGELCALKTMVGGVGATFSLGLKPIQNTAYTTKPTILLGASGIATLNSLDADGNFIPTQMTCGIGTGTQIKTWTTYTILLSISGATITAGKFQGVIHFANLEL